MGLRIPPNVLRGLSDMYLYLTKTTMYLSDKSSLEIKFFLRKKSKFRHPMNSFYNGKY